MLHNKTITSPRYSLPYYIQKIVSSL